GFLHELLSIHSAEELDCVRTAGKLCRDAMDAMVARARPGVKEYELRAAAGAAILEGGGDIDFLIIGSTPMANPAMIFGNPRPTQCHGIDLVTDNPHVAADHVSAAEFETVLKPGMVIMAEPNPITPDGMFGIFLGHTFIVTDTGHEIVDDFPLEIAVAASS